MRLPLIALLAGFAITPAIAQTPAPAPASPPVAAAPAKPAPAAKPGRMTFQQRFDAANTTHDGKLTLDQAKAAKMTRVAQNFDAIDTTKKGSVTMGEIQAYNRAQRAAAKPKAQ